MNELAGPDRPFSNFRHKIRRFPDLETLKLWKGRSGSKQSSIISCYYQWRCSFSSPRTFVFVRNTFFTTLLLLRLLFLSFFPFSFFQRSIVVIIIIWNHHHDSFRAVVNRHTPDRAWRNLRVSDCNFELRKICLLRDFEDRKLWNVRSGSS